MGIFRCTAEKGGSFCESVAEHFSGRICAACSAANIQLVGAEVEQERRHLVAADAGASGCQQLVKAAVPGGDVLFIAPEHRFGCLSVEIGVISKKLPELRLIHAGIDACHDRVAANQYACRLIVHLVIVFGIGIILSEQPCLIGPAHGIIIGMGRVEFLVFVVSRKGGIVRFRSACDAVEHIDKLAQPCRSLAAEGIRRLRIHIAFAVHVEDTGLIENALDVREYHRVRKAPAAGLPGKDVGIVIAVEDVAGELEPAVHIEPVGFRQLAGDCGILVGGITVSVPAS